MQNRSSPGSSPRCRSSLSSAASALFVRRPSYSICALFLLALLPFTIAQAPPVTHIVSVGRRGDDLALRFTPEETIAAIGDLVQFQFYPANHSAVSADFNSPCMPLDPNDPRAFFSGFHPLPPDPDVLTSFTIPVTSTEPLFFYCAQGRHCQQGFVGVINPNQQQTLAAFRAAAANAPANVAPGSGQNPPSQPTTIPVPSNLPTNSPPPATLIIPSISRVPNVRTTSTSSSTRAASPTPDRGRNDIINEGNGDRSGGNGAGDRGNGGPTAGDGNADGNQENNPDRTSANRSNPVRNIGAIVGIVLGGVVFLALIIGGVVYYMMRRKRRKNSIFGGNAGDFTQPLTSEKGLGDGASDIKNKFKISSPSAPLETTYIPPEPDRSRTGFIPIGASAQPTPPRAAPSPAPRTPKLPLKSPARSAFAGGGGEIKPLNIAGPRRPAGAPTPPPPVALDRSNTGRNPIDSYISALGFDDPNAPYVPPTRGYTVIAKGNPYEYTASNGSPTAPASPSSVYTYSIAMDSRRPASPPPPMPRLDYNRPGR